MELRGLVLTAAGAAVPEAGQRRPYLHALHRDRALDGFTELQEGERDDELDTSAHLAILLISGYKQVKKQ